MRFSSLSLLVCNRVLPRQVNIDRFKWFTLNPTGPGQLRQRMFGFDMEYFFEFGSRVPLLRTPYQGLGGIKQIAETRKPNGPVLPQSQGIKPSNGSQGVILAPMRIAAKVLQVCQLAKNRTARRVTQSRLELLKGHYFMVFQNLLLQPLSLIQAVFTHSGIQSTAVLRISPM